MMLPHKDQFSGCLIGQCLGDALGFVVEGFSPEACKRYVEDYLKSGKAGEFGHFPFPFGQYSDDSQLARELLISYVACKKFDPHDYAERIMRIFVERKVVGFGYATRQAALRLFDGISWEESGTPAPSAGNGSAMRSAPVGLIYFDNPQLLIQSAHDQGRITHKDPRCSAGAVSISGAVALVLQGRPVEPETFLTTLADWADKPDPNFAAELLKLVKWVSMPPEEAGAFISKSGIDAEYIEEDGWKGISPFVISSVLWSLYSFLRTPDDYWETICTAISAGGDVDTTAAMAGAISGAYLGLGAIPSHLSKYLTDRGTWGLDDLVELTHQCYYIKMQHG
ncbi:MAG: crystallin J1 [Nitrospirae bacterium RBG_13_39_12]|nr:MAG: crystallin J1 [Nitrospirae bacterium RBG_13_39_12]